MLHVHKFSLAWITNDERVMSCTWCVRPSHRQEKHVFQSSVNQVTSITCGGTAGAGQLVKYGNGCPGSELGEVHESHGMVTNVLGGR